MNKMNFSKASLSVDGKDVHMSMPFAKVDKSARTVSGFATLDNVDTQGDVVLAEASAKAFARARGNIREQHDPYKAVGRMVDFREEEFYHIDESGEGKFFRGIFVTARVSEGAEDTWLKVLDGTLSGFSIGGEVLEAESEYVPEAGKVVKFIKDYELTELSLVDNPANQLANVVSIQKSAGGSVVLSGMAVEANAENVFICPNDETVVVKGVEKSSCPACSEDMEYIGWFESIGDRAEKVRAIVSNHLSKGADTPISFGEGGVIEVGVFDKSKKVKSEEDVADEVETEDEDVVEEVDEESDVEADLDADEESEESGEDEESDEDPEAADVDEVVDEESEISRRLDELQDTIRQAMNDSKEETIAKVHELDGKIDDVHKSFISKAEELEAKINDFGPKLEAQKSRLAELESRLEKINAADAVKKSAGIPVERKNVQNESFWDGAFSG